MMIIANGGIDINDRHIIQRFSLRDFEESAGEIAFVNEFNHLWSQRAVTCIN